MKCMWPERASAGMLRESLFSPACSTKSQKRRSISVAFVWFGVPTIRTENEESRSRGSVIDEGPGRNQTVTQILILTRSRFLRAAMATGPICRIQVGPAIHE